MTRLAPDHAEAFLDRAGWAGATRKAIAGDASARRYERVTRPDGGSAILMIVPDGLRAVTARYLAMTDWLRGAGLSAPAVLARDDAGHMTLVEDLGDGVFAWLVKADPGLEGPLYAAAVDVLAAIQDRAPPPVDSRLDDGGLSALSSLLSAHYLPVLDAPGDIAAVAAETGRLWADLGLSAEVLALRDFHAENLIWLPGRDGPARVGLIDFQDAALAHPAYDLVSLLQDARRDVPAATEVAMIARFRAATGADDRFGAAYALVGVHRALRILAVFARLALLDGKPRYLDLAPRVWGHLLRNLAHPALTRLSAAVLTTVPEPTAVRIARLRQAAAR